MPVLLNGLDKILLLFFVILNEETIHPRIDWDRVTQQIEGICLLQIGDSIYAPPLHELPYIKYPKLLPLVKAMPCMVACHHQCVCG